jgi:CIC family chloride channel protein
LRVKDLMKASFPCVPLTAPFAEITKGFVNHPTDHLGVVTGDNQFCGVISLHDVKAHLQDAELGALVTAAELMREGIPLLTPHRSLLEAMDLFTRHDGDQLPVINNLEDRKLMGCISKTDLLLTLAHGVDWEAQRPAQTGA